MPLGFPIEDFFQVSHRGFVVFCLRCAELADGIMRSDRYRADWPGSRSSIYEAGLAAASDWTDVRSPATARTDAAGQALAEAFAAADHATRNAVDAGDDTGGARAVREAAVGMIVPMAMRFRGAGVATPELWVPGYTEGRSPREIASLPWSHTQLGPDAPFLCAAACMERLLKVTPAGDRARVVEGLRERLRLLRSMTDPIRSEVDDLMPPGAEMG